MQPKTFPPWMRLVLAAAGLYNLVWGAVTILAPNLIFDWASMTRPNYPELWQCIGMIVGVYGIGYWFASADPVRHWPIVLVGLIGKILGPIGMVGAVADGRFPLEFAWIGFGNDVIWWVPFAMILAHAVREDRKLQRAFSPEVQGWAMRAKTQFGLSILEHSKLRPVLLVFLRHIGCTFCRETLKDLSAKRQEIESGGTQIVLVHMGREAMAEKILKSYDLLDVPRVWDPKLALYRAFGLEKGDAIQLYGPKVWWRGVKAGLIAGHGIGRAEGDVNQMPGIFLVFHGELLKSYKHHSAADRPNYIEFVCASGDIRRGIS